MRITTVPLLLVATLCVFVSSCGGGQGEPDSVSPPAMGPDKSEPLADVQSPSVARRWNEVLLEAIRNDYARPTSHSRNLFHLSAAMYDAWAAYSTQESAYFLGQTLNGFSCPFARDAFQQYSVEAREATISYAAYRLITHRFSNSPSVAYTLLQSNELMDAMGLNPALVASSAEGNAAELGNYIADCYIRYGLQDGSNEANSYQSRYYQPVNPPIAPAEPGNPEIKDLGRWQAIELETSIDQAGNQVSAVPDFIGAEWGDVLPFALTEADQVPYQRDGNQFTVYLDPGEPPYPNSHYRDIYQRTFALVAIWGSHLDPQQTPIIDISPAALGNLDIADFPRDFSEYDQFYALFEGGDPSRGRAINPFTGKPYVPQNVSLGDYTRVLAEFWADGPESETPPGHWFVILNHVVDHPEFERQMWGSEQVGPLEWDIKAYFSLGGAMHDSAVAAWSNKGWYDFVRPVSAIRAMADLGQSTDPDAASYHPDGLPLYEGFIGLVQAGDPLADGKPDNIGKIKLYSWRGPETIESPQTDAAGVGWILAENWWPYQRPTFVTPPFAGYVSGHSTFSRAAAEVLTAITGSEYFPGGMGEFLAPKDEFLVFEQGPSTDVILQWATYRDASDQCSLSRIWGGIHPPVDDLRGRLMGEKVAQKAVAQVQKLFAGN
ncbi:vanadium-dependent haloperoxidase [Gilvimarinus agarilyticus]|uniref:vanadium-dependent haloperoxidase n=1 Tax=Gilvimarinus sp. 2_MG-2023 TaxID=3062666 RepID=UPI001C0A4673|nr:vanadium-dependent haloperoxidase [Gilvimarinus sp. 2_MG-2023]MBU2886731.1 vanadium-dependent haloperoxidase [Gilvimarinus agarilyticus]MDO6571397.1 vanadium-dependent haloperoxidase [Gilvimarinus sp. 2_MG-2023]